jgi:microcin C transport system permease protein
VRWEPFERNDQVANWPSPPTPANWMGTDVNGRDVLSRLLYGFRYSFAFAFSVWAFRSVIGITLGASMRYFDVFVDLFGQRCMEVFESIPYFLLLIILIAMFSPNVFWRILLNTVFGWMAICQYVRGGFGLSPPTPSWGRTVQPSTTVLPYRRLVSRFSGRRSVSYLARSQHNW